jgi:sigma-E factor negative regulatory protein RseB
VYVTVNHRRRVALLSATMTAAVTATMTVAVSLLVAACGGQPASQTRAEALVSAAPSSPQAQEHARTQPRRKSSPLALSLLTKAAQAAMLTSYWGVEIVTNSDMNGSVSEYESAVWHVSGGQTITQTQAAGADVSAQPYQSQDLDDQSPEGVLGVTQTLVKLLETHYVVTYEGSAQLDSRPVRVVEIWRADGSLAAEFWLDQATDLPLQRQVFTDSASTKSAHVISLDAFNEVQFGAPAQLPAVVPAAAKAAAMSTMAPPVLLALNGHGWVVKSIMPGGLTLFSGGETDTKSGQVLDLAYSDGLFVVSVFEERGKLASTPTGWQKVKLGGQTVYAAEPDAGSLTWSGRGMVYTLIADAPAQTVVAAVGVLPHDEPPGFWKRLSHGFARLAHLANPFG